MRDSSYSKRRKKFFLYIFFLSVLSVSVFLMAVGAQMREKTMLPIYLSGVMFWIGLIGTTAMAIIINRSRKASAAFDSMYPELKQFGLISFFKNIPAAIFDVIMIASLAGMIASQLLIDALYPKFAVIALFVFSFGMHCMLNGISYIYVNYRARRFRES